MFTVKLYRFPSDIAKTEAEYRIVEAKEVSIYYIIPGERTDVGITDINGMFESVRINHVPTGPDAWEDGQRIWDRAYIENAAGKTTQVVGL